MFIQAPNKGELDAAGVSAVRGTMFKSTTILTKWTIVVIVSKIEYSYELCFYFSCAGNPNILYKTSTADLIITSITLIS